MLHAGLDLSRRRLDVCLISDEGEVVGEFAVPPDADGLRGLARRLGPVEVRCVIESMTGARLVHDTLEQLGWDGLIADAQKHSSSAPAAASTGSHARPARPPTRLANDATSVRRRRRHAPRSINVTTSKRLVPQPGGFREPGFGREDAARGNLAGADFPELEDRHFHRH